MFCGKCGKELNENGLCSVCNPESVVEDVPIKPVVEETPIKPMEKFDSSSNGVKPLASASWFAPVAFLAPAIVADIIAGIINLFPALFSDDYELHTIVIALVGAASALITVALAVGGVYLFYKMAFKSVDPVLKKKSELIIFLPFVGYWVRTMLSRVLITPLTSVLYMLITSSGEYTVASMMTGIISGVGDIAICIVVAAGLLMLSKKILTKIEEK